MDDNYMSSSSTYQAEKFALNSYNRVVDRKGKGKGPDPSFSMRRPRHDGEVLSELVTGKKCSDIDLQTLEQHFNRYVHAVNLVLGEAYSTPDRAQHVGQRLRSSRGQGYVVLREDKSLQWQQDNKFGLLVYERMYRNVLETAARIILADYTRRTLVNSLITILASDSEHLRQLMGLKRIPAPLIRTVRASVHERSGSYYHYALAACKQVRRVLDEHLLERLGESTSIRRLARSRVRDLLDTQSPESIEVLNAASGKVQEWLKTGFPFTAPSFKQTTMEFAASTENSTSQGYWFAQDPKLEDEFILYIKTPPGVTRHESTSDSPYKSQTLRFRFLDWLPRKAARAQRKAEESRNQGHFRRAVELEYRAARFKDMSQQLRNTIALQSLTRELSSVASKKDTDVQRISELRAQTRALKEARRCVPPILSLRGHTATLIIPFLCPDDEMLKRVLPAVPRTGRAGVDRGLRCSVALSVRNGADGYDETMIGRPEAFTKREMLRQRTRVLMSQIVRRRNNWERKRPMLSPPSSILKRERELEAVWTKVRRIDREISHQLAAETVWFCEHRSVKTVYFEDLRYFQPEGGFRTHSWKLSTNLWGKIIEGVRYRRQALGHRYCGVWTVNPAMTSQRCSACGERGVRVRDSDSTEEEHGGEFFYCPSCDLRLHADTNAARNILMVQQPKPSAVSGRTA